MRELAAVPRVVPEVEPPVEPLEAEPLVEPPEELVPLPTKEAPVPPGSRWLVHRGRSWALEPVALRRQML